MILKNIIKTFIIDYVINNIVDKVYTELSTFRQLDISEMPLGYSFKITIYTPFINIIREDAIVVDLDGNYRVVEVRCNRPFTLLFEDNDVQSISPGKYK
jgi:hypothetical protein